MANVLYLSVVEDLKKKITSGILMPDDMLNSESELVKEYNVSRMTLRKSLSLLSNEGYIYSVPGKGYFIRKPDTDIYQFRFNEYDSLITEIDNIKLISVTIDKPTEYIKNNLTIVNNQPVAKIERLIYCNDEPIAYEMVFTPYTLNKPIIEDKISFANYSKAFETKFAFSIKKEIEIKIICPEKSISDKLGLDKNESVFQVRKKILKKDNNYSLNYSIFYIKTNYFILTAKTPEDDESKKIF